MAAPFYILKSNALGFHFLHILTTLVILFFFLNIVAILKDLPGNSAGKESACNAGDPSSIPGSARSPGEGVDYPIQNSWASLVAQMVENMPAVWETWVWSLGWEDSLQEGMATNSHIPAWIISWTEEPGGLQPIELQILGHAWVTKYAHMPS